MVKSTSVETKLDTVSWEERVYSWSFYGSLVYDLSLCNMMFYVIKELTEESGDFFPYCCLLPKVITGASFMLGLVYHYEW